MPATIQICIICDCEFVDWNDEELEHCDNCSESDIDGREPSDPTPEEIAAEMLLIRLEKHELPTVPDTKEAELNRRRMLRNEPEKAKRVVRKKKARSVQRVMF